MLRPASPDSLQAQLAAQHSLARHLIGARSLTEVAPTFLAIVGELLDWQVGALWEVERQPERLRLAGSWSSPQVDAAELWEQGRAIAFTPGVGLPGRAWSTGELTWADALAKESNFPRREAALRAGLGGGFAIPIPVGEPESVMAVCEFFTSSFETPSQSVIALLVGFTDQLAMFITRRRTEDLLRKSESVKSMILSSSPDAVIGTDAAGRIIEWSRAAEELFGFARAEAIGEELASLIIPRELRDARAPALARLLTEEAPAEARTETVAVDRHGTRIPVELSVARMPEADPPAFTTFVRNIRGRGEAERARAHLAAIAADSEDAVMAKDLEGYVTAWNRGAEHIYGYTAAEAIGRHISFLIPPDHADEEKEILERIRGGERVETYETERLRKDGVRIDVALTVSPIRDPIFGITGASILARDVTAEKRQRSAEEFLARSTAAFEASRDPHETARAIVAAAVPQLAELCVIDLIRPDGSIGDTTAAAVDPTIARTLEELRARQPLRPDSEHPVAEAVRRGLPVVERDLTPEDVRARVAQSGEHGDLIVAAVYNSAAVLPMYARGRLIGALTFLHVRSDRRYDSSDVSLLSQLASRAGLAIDNARLYRERDRIARTLQAGLRPERPAEVPGADIAVIFEPAGEGIEVGGDFYDIFASPRGWFILIGDVVGKGSEAAILSAQVRHTARALARVGWPGDRIMATINDVLREAPGKNSLATAQLLELGDGDGSVARLVGAGHPPAVLVGENGTRLVGGGTMLGVIADARPAVELVELGPDDTLILYTDGWLEAGALASHREPNELAGLVERERGQRLTVLLEQLRRDAFTRAGGDLRDDLVIVGLRRAPVADRRAALAGAAASASSRS